MFEAGWEERGEGEGRGASLPRRRKKMDAMCVDLRSFVGSCVSEAEGLECIRVVEGSKGSKVMLKRRREISDGKADILVRSTCSSEVRRARAIARARWTDR